MSGIAATLQQNRARAAGIGTNAQAAKFLNQDYEALKRECLGCGRLFEDDTYEANPSALGFKELGPNSSKVRGLKWLRPKVGVCLHCAYLINTSLLRAHNISYNYAVWPQ